MDNGFSHLREFGKFQLDVDKKVLWWNGAPVQLPPKEAELLAILTEHAGEVVTKTELMDRLWSDSFVEESNLSRHVYRLRRLFEERGELAGLIETVPRRGYRFTGPVTVANPDVIIERHSISRTLIEEIETSDEPRRVTAPKTSAPRRRRRWAYAVATLAVVLASLGAYRGLFPASADASSIRSIAVVPFRSLNSQEADRGVVIADLLIAKLSNIKDLSIRPTSSVLRFSQGEVDVSTVGRDLAVDAVIEGSYRESNGKIFVTARLVRSSGRSTLWSRDFDMPEPYASFAHDQIAMQIADALAIDLSGRERQALEKRYSQFPDAMRMYETARYHWSKRDNPGISEAYRLFTNAVAVDPNFALAYVGIADASMFRPNPREAEFAVERALSIDPGLGEAYATRGFIRMFHKWDWSGAEQDFRYAIELKPGYPSSYQWYATLLMIKGKPKEAEALLLKALELDPVSPNLYSDLAQAHYYSGDLDQAEKAARRSLELDAEFVPAQGWLSEILFAQGRFEEAFQHERTFGRGLTKQPHQLPVLDDATEPEHVRAFRREGVHGYWRNRDAVLEAPDGDGNANQLIARAQAKMNLGDTAAAISNLERAIDEHAFLAPFLNVDPTWDSLRSDPEFERLISKMGL